MPSGEAPRTTGQRIGQERSGDFGVKGDPGESRGEWGSAHGEQGFSPGPASPRAPSRSTLSGGGVRGGIGVCSLMHPLHTAPEVPLPAPRRLGCRSAGSRPPEKRGSGGARADVSFNYKHRRVLSRAFREGCEVKVLRFYAVAITAVVVYDQQRFFLEQSAALASSLASLTNMAALTQSKSQPGGFCEDKTRLARRSSCSSERRSLEREQRNARGALRADHQAREDRETGEEHRMRENTAFHLAVCPGAGACPSPTSPSPVALAEALTGLPSRPLPPRGPWQVCATAPVKGRARFAALATGALSAFSSSAATGRVPAVVFACPPNGGSCPRSGGSRVDRSSRRGWL